MKFQEEVSLNSDRIGEIAKAKIYASEPGRFPVNDDTIQVQGDNHPHTITVRDERLVCSCDYYRQGWGDCSHTMAAVKIYGDDLVVTLLSARERTAAVA